MGRDGLEAGQAAAGGLRHRVRPQRHGRQGRTGVRRHRLLRRRPGEPIAGDSPVRRHPGRSPLDRLRRRHDHPTQRGAPREQLQDHRRPRRQRPRRRRRVHHAPVRLKHHHPQHPRPRLRPCRERQRAGLADALRVADALRRRRHLALLGAQRVGGPLRAVALRRRPHRRHHGIHGDHRVEQLLLPPQRGDAAGSQRRIPAGLGDAGDHRVQPLRNPARAADAAVQEGLLPHRQQRLHGVGDVRHWRERESHHQQPGQPLHCPRRPQRQGGDEAGGHGGGAVGGVELEDGGGHDGERRLLRPLRRRPRGHLRQGLQHRPQVVGARRPAHRRRRRPRRAQGQRRGGGVRRRQLRRSWNRRRRRWRRRRRRRDGVWLSRDGLWQQRQLELPS